MSEVDMLLDAFADISSGDEVEKAEALVSAGTPPNEVLSSLFELAVGECENVPDDMAARIRERVEMDGKELSHLTTEEFLDYIYETSVEALFGVVIDENDHVHEFDGNMVSGLGNETEENEETDELASMLSGM